MLRYLPSVNDLLEQPAIIELISGSGRVVVTSWVRQAIDGKRESLRGQSERQPASNDDSKDAAALRDLLRIELLEIVAGLARKADLERVKGIINATGIVLHTGLGRAPLSAGAKQALQDAAGACNAEVDIATGDRRYRGYQLNVIWQLLTGCESSLIVNNNAAATLLTLQALCANREVIISRGELIEIGGSFRLPEIFELSGAILREVGTTNRTSLRDYERAIGPDTAAIMHVHTSNYRVVGFTSKPDDADMFALAREYGVLAIDDIGSGALFDTTEAGLPYEPTFQHSIAAGADVVLGSGDKLLGGPQCGIIIGSDDAVAKVRNHPLARAVRVDKLTLAALGATLESYTRDEARSEIPTQAMLFATAEELQQRAETIVAEIADVPGLSLSIRDDVAQVGGGSLPTVELPTVVIALRHQKLSADELARRLRTGRIGVFVRIQNDEVLLDVRSVLPEDDSRLALAIRLIRPEH
ncbi:MAG: L-seryl-tRNA(Sec) selenium transferase [Planctomycetota bacterium]|nr:L-seryl-tRNA(Sec) selenium transferase [Planctomycetota bacterium]